MVDERLQGAYSEAWGVFMGWFEQSLYFEYKDWQTDEEILDKYVDFPFEARRTQKIPIDETLLDSFIKAKQELQSILKNPFEWKDSVENTIGINYWDKPRLPREGGGVFPASKEEFKAATGRDWDADKEYIRFLELCVTKMNEAIERTKEEIAHLEFLSKWYSQDKT